MSNPSTGMADSASSRIAVLITCHNRSHLTERCLNALSAQSITASTITTFLVDDGCTDDTRLVAETAAGSVVIVDGSGSLFWNGGMNEAWKAAANSESKYDFFLWLNDDVELTPNAIQELLNVHSSVLRSEDKECIVVGTLRDPISGVPTYGGNCIANSNRPLRMALVQPSIKEQRCDTFSGNLVLIPREVFNRLGYLNKNFVHIYGDLDYGLRAKKAGIWSLVAPGTLGTCCANSTKGTSHDRSLPLTQRIAAQFRHDQSVHGRDWRTFLRTHLQRRLTIGLYTASPYVKMFFNALFCRTNT